MIRYRFCRLPDTALHARLRDPANERRRFGYQRSFILLRREGELSGINRIHRLYREEGLSVRKPAGTRGGHRCPGAAPCRGTAERALVQRLRLRPVRQRTVRSRPEHCRRRHPAMPGRPAVTTAVSPGTSSRRASRRRTASLKASMAACTKSCSTRRCSSTSPMHARKLPLWFTTQRAAPTQASPDRRPWTTPWDSVARPPGAQPRVTAPRAVLSSPINKTDQVTPGPSLRLDEKRQINERLNDLPSLPPPAR